MCRKAISVMTQSGRQFTLPICSSEPEYISQPGAMVAVIPQKP